MTSHRWLRLLVPAVLSLLLPCAAAAQADTQLWTEFKFNWIKSRQLTLGVDAEPKVLIWAPAGDPGWATLDVTPSLEYSRGEWFDMVGELLVGRTRQTDDLDSTEVTPRIGFRLHLLSNLREELVKEKRPKRRLVIRDLIRLEWRNLYYSTDKPEFVHGPAAQPHRNPVAGEQAAHHRQRRVVSDGRLGVVHSRR